jgi:hypothetical protein
MKRMATLAVLVLLLPLGGCSSVLQKTTGRFADNFGAAILNSEDPGTVRDGLPAYLLLLDSLIEGQTEGEVGNAPVLLAAARLNGAYAGNFTGDDAVRAQRLSSKSLRYARRATCLQDAGLCAALDQDLDQFSSVVQRNDNSALMYALASSWAGYLQTHTEDWEAISDLPKIEALLMRAVALEPALDHGQAYVFLGVINSLRPEAVGGKPEQGRAYFEQAIALSDRKNLYAMTLEAEFYARLVFDQALHDRLLGEVLSADPKAPGFTLTNTLAQDRARKLLDSGKDFF